MGDVPNPLQATLYYRPNFAHVEFDLKEGQEVVADAGTLMWMGDSVEMSTSCHHGCCAGYWRGCAGESCCQNTFRGPGKVALGDEQMPGDMLPFPVTKDKGWIFSTGAFVCASPNVHVSAKWNGCYNCMCSGEGAFLTHITLHPESEEAFGVAYIGDYGAFQAHHIPPGHSFYIDNGLFLACSDKYRFETVVLGGCKTCCFGGEGFMLKFTATLEPLTVYTQNRDPAVMKALLKPPSPPNYEENAEAGGAAVNAVS